MRSYGGIDITQNLIPPKSLYAEVICIEDAGDLELESGIYQNYIWIELYLRRINGKGIHFWKFVSQNKCLPEPFANLRTHSNSRKKSYENSMKSKIKY